MTGARSRPSIRDVAGAAGVSVATVSQVLNNVGRISAATRERVQAAAEKLSYQPNPSARRMRGQRTGVVGIVDRVDPRSSWKWNDPEFVVALTHACCEHAWDRSWYPALLPVAPGGSRLADAPIDGAIVIDPTPGDECLAELDELGVPVVTMGRDINDPDRGWWVDNDKYQQGRDALAHLQRAGSEHLLVLGADIAQSYMADNLDAARQSSEREQLDTQFEILPASSTPADCYRLLQSVFARSPRIDGVYALVEAFLQPLFDALSDASLEVPNDVRIVASTESSRARGARVPVTSFDLHPDRLGRALVDLLATRMAEPGSSGPAPTVVVPTSLITRASSLSGEVLA